MAVLTIEMPSDPDCAAVARLNQGMTLLARGYAAATVPRALAARKGNPMARSLRPWGDACKGLYQLIGSVNVPEDCHAEYGPTLIALEPVGGEALDAEALGRLGIALYAGKPGADGALRRTQGGVRLAPDMMQIILRRLTDGDDLVLDIVAHSSGWWQFWRKKTALPPLSSEAPHFVDAPLDEATLLAEAMRNGVSRKSRVSTPDEDDDRRTPDSASGGGDAFQGQGGTYGGGGASGSWGGSGPQAAAKGGGAAPPGVDAAGRMLGGVAGGLGAAAMAAELAGSAGREGTGGDDVRAEEGSSADAENRGGGGTAY